MEPHLDGRVVALMQTRHAAELAALVERHGGVPVAAPCLREAAVEDAAPLAAALHELAGAPLDLAIFQTGVGTDRLLAAAAAAGLAEAVLERLAGAVVVARGPKPLAVLLRNRIRVDRRTPEPHTTAEVVELVEDDLGGLRVVLQHYGSPNLELAALLRGRGSDLLEISTYHWRLPHDTGPIRSFLVRLEAGELDLTVFTSASQVDNLFHVAEVEGVDDRLAGWLATNTEVAAVGPICAAALRARGVPVRIEPVRPKMVPLVRALCEHVATAGAAGSRSAKRTAAQVRCSHHGRPRACAEPERSVMPESERDHDATAAPAVDVVEVDRIRDRGWRDHADAGDPAYLVLLASVRSRGVLVPLVVRAHPDGGYQLVSGARRLQAAREAGRATVPVTVRMLGDVAALIGGAWAALTRSGVSPDEVERLRGQLVSAGVTDDDAELLAGSLPRAADVELSGRPRAEREDPAPAWAWGGAARAAEQPRRGRLRLSRRSGR